MLRYLLMKSSEILRKFSLVPSLKTRSCSSRARVFIDSIPN
jgi:peroxiredoxin